VLQSNERLESSFFLRLDGLALLLLVRVLVRLHHWMVGDVLGHIIIFLDPQY